jgi:hypothetical protein
VTNVQGPQIPPLATHELGTALVSCGGGPYGGFVCESEPFPVLHDFVRALGAAFRAPRYAADAAAGRQRQELPGSSG